MISTVTTSTITTVTTIAALGLTAAIGTAAMVVLIAFVTTKELAGAGWSTGLQLMGKALIVPIVPLVMVFAAIVAVKVAEVLG